MSSLGIDLNNLWDEEDEVFTYSSQSSTGSTSSETHCSNEATASIKHIMMIDLDTIWDDEPALALGCRRATAGALPVSSPPSMSRMDARPFRRRRADPSRRVSFGNVSTMTYDSAQGELLLEMTQPLPASSKL
mmetsp:Transcript_27059/g.62554  ORF Transcript_27059/g.62554 Transcript_27059/m.62554 type:complete len:133 (+) Transcript_27059:80-478(+)